MHTSPSPVPERVPARRRPDVRGRALTITALATVALGAAIAWMPGEIPLPRLPDLQFSQIVDMRPRPASPREAEIRTRFEQGVMMLHMRQYEFALTAFHNVLALAPEMPEAHVNMGFALLGLEQWESARDFFESATNLRRDQINAYYGLAVALEGLGDLPGAIGSMQAYLHRAPADDPFRIRAEAALWEWREGSKPAAENPAPGGAAEPDN